MKIKPTATIAAGLLSSKLQVVENSRVILDDRDQLVAALVPILEALADHVADQVADRGADRPPRRYCVACRCLLLPRDRRCPGCDAQAGRHLEPQLRVG